ncbi:Bifunctional inhibitor/lipid-transfer protein/seed storage 2S albumin superfamily protein [Striga hermonthica]|uniref:Bifunctional inhibitor/lipid-transfer protein/seed storage 2S albumin superfamily protein n=1 Tax=Striga hermonthica TaxID=68872 RepID=A0A9N7MUU5_STRHE|nr:Bifunctional inhibitor/lipid-transfer protein/seed storage 2S albumin superfamily protein [Striga hermonthica]
MSRLALLFAFFLVISRSTACNCADCRDIFINFGQCAPFVEGLTENPSPFCCQKVAILNSIAKQEKGGAQRICECIEQFRKFNGNLKYDESHIEQLPVKCRTSLSFPISENMNCSKIK